MNIILIPRRQESTRRSKGKVLLKESATGFRKNWIPAFGE